MELSYFIAHARYAYSLENLTARNIAAYAPEYLYGSIFIPEEDRVLSFKLQNADSLCEYIANASHIIGFRGNVLGIPTLRRYFGLKGRVPKKGKHTDIYSALVKLNGGQTVSVEKAFYSNNLTDKYERICNLSKLTEQDLEQYSASTAKNIYKLFELHKAGKLKIKTVAQQSGSTKRERNISTLEKEAILTIELVPRTSWFSNMRSEVSKAEWDAIRRKAYRENDYKCSICGGVGKRHPVECHEIWHYDDQKHQQTLVGFTALCPSCHAVKHIGFSNAQGRGELAQEHLSKVNGWSNNETKKYVKAQFDKWIQRNHCEWDLNLSLLENLGIKYKRNEQWATPDIQKLRGFPLRFKPIRFGLSVSPDVTYQQGVEMSETSEIKPSENEEDYWIYSRHESNYPEHTERGGKWLVFVKHQELDEWWGKIKSLLHKGKLGKSAKTDLPPIFRVV